MKNEIDRIIWQVKYEVDSNWLKATQTLKKAIEKYPHELRLHNELGNLYFFRDAYEQAVKCYEQALNLDSRNVDIIFKLAYCHLVNRDFETAEQYFDLISEVIPEATYNRCVALYKLDKGYQAIELLEELILSSDYSEKPYILLGKLYLEYERYDKIIDLIERAEKRFGKVSELLYIRGAAYFHTRQWLKAYVDFLDTESSQVETPSFYRMYALTCEKIGQTNKAIEILNQSIEKFPPYYGAYYDLIKIYTMHDRYSEAIKVMNKLNELGITFGEISGNEGRLFDLLFNVTRMKGKE